MTTGAFNDPSSDGHALRQRLVVLQIWRVIKEIVCNSRPLPAAPQRPWLAAWHFGGCQPRLGLPSRAGPRSGALAPSYLVLIDYREKGPEMPARHTVPHE